MIIMIIVVTNMRRRASSFLLRLRLRLLPPPPRSNLEMGPGRAQIVLKGAHELGWRCFLFGPLTRGLRCYAAAAAAAGWLRCRPCRCMCWLVSAPLRLVTYRHTALPLSRWGWHGQVGSRQCTRFDRLPMGGFTAAYTE